ncbi:Dehydroquinate synthase-like protein [Violaceomyces palustris]|uniref:Dehydroquinate synthase-like protein n=1 Tax=Violaceomyces palustris TaxID=1673888 RepID=A0ACD0NUC2_9BASI|nr:Dehydroquinate synthase-like protein [Violaceomyces palustris]
MPINLKSPPQPCPPLPISLFSFWAHLAFASATPPFYFAPLPSAPAYLPTYPPLPALPLLPLPLESRTRKTMSLAAPLGVYRNTCLQTIHWGPGCLSKTLPESVRKLGKTKVLILTGKTLATKTDVVSKVEKALGDYHGATFYEIGEHAPIQSIRKAVQLIQDVKADVIVSVGGGSPIDSAKAISHILHQESRGKVASDEGNEDYSSFLPSIAIPTTLSMAETTQNAGFKNEEGDKVGVSHPALVPRVIIYDAQLTLDTPERLWLSTGVRALDHAIEFLYRFDSHPLLRNQSYGAIRELFTFLPLSKQRPQDVNVRQRLQLSVVSSLWPESRKGALGLSHGLGHKLGATYAIGHGITSCLTLAPSIRLTATSHSTPLEQLAALADSLAYIPPPHNPSPTPLGAAVGSVAEAVQSLVDQLGLHSTLKGEGVPRNEVELIATRATGEDKKGSLEWLAIKELLESIYE